MRVPSWLPTSALVGMLVYLVIYIGMTVVWMFTRNDGWLIAGWVLTVLFLVGNWIWAFHLRNQRRRKAKEMLKGIEWPWDEDGS